MKIDNEIQCHKRSTICTLQIVDIITELENSLVLYIYFREIMSLFIVTYNILRRRPTTVRNKQPSRFCDKSHVRQSHVLSLRTPDKLYKNAEITWFITPG